MCWTVKVEHGGHTENVDIRTAIIGGQESTSGMRKRLDPPERIDQSSHIMLIDYAATCFNFDDIMCRAK